MGTLVHVQSSPHSMSSPMLIVKTRVPQVATRERINHEAWSAIREGGGRQTDMALEHTGVCLRKIRNPHTNGGSRYGECQTHGVREHGGVQPKTVSFSATHLDRLLNPMF